MQFPPLSAFDPLSHSSFFDWYADTDVLVSSIQIASFFAALVWLLSIPTNNHSWVDKSWSLLPPFYALHFCFHDLIAALVKGNSLLFKVDDRMLAIAILSTAWGIRLTFNFYRKGGYAWNGEDYRWDYIRERVPRILFEVFNIVFIAIIQNALLLALALPSYWSSLHRKMPLGPLDYIAAVGAALCIVGEGIADQNQWNFQTLKHKPGTLREKAKKHPYFAEDLRRGFITRGLFSISRHPNFFCEISLWYFIYLFGVSASGQWVNWTIGGTLFLTALFQGSTWLTEKISSGKYPDYALYQKRVSRLFPLFPSNIKSD